VRYARFPNAEQFIHTFLSPLYRLRSECATVVLTVDDFAAIGQWCLIRLSQPMGPRHQLLEGLLGTHINLFLNIPWQV
jgi:hypothetical protein